MVELLGSCCAELVELFSEGGRVYQIMAPVRVRMRGGVVEVLEV
jgi:hypothetical protein